MSDEGKQEEKEYRRMIIAALAKIGWKLKDVGCGYFRFYNQYEEAQPIVFYFDRIQLDEDKFSGVFSICFYMKDVEIDFYPDGNGIGFRGKTDTNIFLNCYNFAQSPAAKP
ncbi:MAG TPA: hypothetical protein VGB00_06560 [Pyrinomonadaceae bacterium]